MEIHVGEERAVGDGAGAEDGGAGLDLAPEEAGCYGHCDGALVFR